MSRVLGRGGLLTILVASACAASPPPNSDARTRAEAASPVSVPAPATGDLVDLALLASGYPRTELEVARGRLERRLAPIADAIRRVKSPRQRGQALLQMLHDKGGLLGRYETRATTLQDVLERGRFNCVSASVLYNLVASRVGLDAGAELLPTHARSLLSIVESGELATVVVETTSRAGFQPDEQALRRILQTVAAPSMGSARAIVPEQGQVVSTRVLIGAMYVNRASIAQEKGNLERAARLFARGESLADSPAMRRILRDQRAALLAQLAADDIVSGQSKRWQRAYQTLAAAVRLGPSEPRIKRAIHQNLRAVSERLVHEKAERNGEAAVRELVAEVETLGLPSRERSGLRAFALSEVARLRLRDEDYEPAIEAFELALREQLPPEDRALSDTLRRNYASALRLGAQERARRGDYEGSMRYVDALERLPGLDRRLVLKDRLRTLHLVGDHRLESGDHVGAAVVFREALRLDRGDDFSRHNLIVALQRESEPLLRSGRCAEVEPLLEEIRALRPDDKFPTQARAGCLMTRAGRLLEKSEFKEAVSLMRAADEVHPGDEAVRQNLSVALYRWAVSLAQASRCRRVKSIVGEIRALAAGRIKERDLETLSRRCP